MVRLSEGMLWVVVVVEQLRGHRARGGARGRADQRKRRSAHFVDCVLIATASSHHLLRRRGTAGWRLG